MALGVVDQDSEAYEWERAQVRRLARHLGYAVVWASGNSVLPLVDQVRQADVDIVIASVSDHLDVLTLNSVMGVVGVETVCPRLSFSRWADVQPGWSG